MKFSSLCTKTAVRNIPKSAIFYFYTMSKFHCAFSFYLSKEDESVLQHLLEYFLPQLSVLLLTVSDGCLYFWHHWRQPVSVRNKDFSLVLWTRTSILLQELLNAEDDWGSTWVDDIQPEPTLSTVPTHPAGLTVECHCSVSEPSF